MRGSLLNLLTFVAFAALFLLHSAHSHPINDLVLRGDSKSAFQPATLDILSREPKGKSSSKSSSSKPKAPAAPPKPAKQDPAKVNLKPSNAPAKPAAKQPTPSKQAPPKEEPQPPKKPTAKLQDPKKSTSKTAATPKPVASPKKSNASTLNKTPSKSASSIQPSATFKGPFPAPKDKCSVETCGQTACKAPSKAGGKGKSKTGGKRSPSQDVSSEQDDSPDQDGSYPVLVSRAFQDLKANTAIANLRKAKSNTDVSDITAASKGLIDEKIVFGNTAKSMTITQLSGCTGVYLFSPKGMYAAHILEFDGYDSNNDLSVEGFESHMQKVATRMKSKASDLFEGGQLHIVFPKTAALFAYDRPQNPKALLKEELAKNGGDIDKASKAIPSSKKVTKPITKFIANKLQATAGILENRVHIYQYGLKSKNSATVRASNTGTFVAQYDPESDDGSGNKGKAIQLSVNGTPVQQRIAL